MHSILSQQLKNLRLRDMRTQDELAQALGVTAQAVSRWETGTCYPDMELLPSIANFFGAVILITCQSGWWMARNLPCM